MTAVLSSWALDPRTMSYADIAAWVLFFAVVAFTGAALWLMNRATLGTLVFWAVSGVGAVFALTGGAS